MKNLNLTNNSNNVSKLFILAITIFLFGFNSNINAQDITFEEVKKICKSDIPREDRIKVSVVRFSSRMRTNDRNDLGSELSSMLTNALYEVNCFRVLESPSNRSDFDAIYDLTDKGYTDNSGSTRGNMLGAQVIITGEITEYSEGEKSISVLGISAGKRKAHVGFILKVLDVNTSDVLYAKSINMEGKSSGFNGLRLGGIKIAGKTNHSKALNNAVEKAIIKAAELLAKSKNDWDIESNQTVLNNNRGIRVVVNGIGYSDVVKFNSKLKRISGVSNVSKAYKNGAGVFSLTSSKSGEEIAEAILDIVGMKYDITEVNENFVSLKKN